MAIMVRYVALPENLKLSCIEMANPRMESTPSIVLTKPWMVGSGHLQNGGQYQLFSVGQDDVLYDTGHLVFVSYFTNTEVEDCLENRMLTHEVTDKNYVRIDFNQEVYPKITLNSHVIRVTLRTQRSGEVSIIRAETDAPFGLDDLYRCGHLFSAIPKVDISCLRQQRYHITFPLHVVTRVDSDNTDLFAFKRLAEAEYLTPPGYGPDDEFVDPLLQEAKAQYELDSPFVLRPTAIVTDSGGFFRGFLMPYHPAGCIQNVLESNHPDAELLNLPPNESDTGVVTLVDPARPTLNGKIKHAWAIDIVSGVVALHSANIVWGDLKLENVLLCKDGRCKLIDVHPGGGYTLHYAAPEYATNELAPPIPEQDIFSLGMTLWALSEEIWRFEREVDFVVPHIVWRSDHPTKNGLAPLWYRDLVEACLSPSPASRPKAQDVLGVLMTHYSSSV